MSSHDLTGLSPAGRGIVELSLTVFKGEVISIRPSTPQQATLELIGVAPAGGKRKRGRR